MSERDWSKIDLTGDPRLLLGRRKSSKKLDVHRVDLHEDLFEDLRAIASSALGELVRREAKPYSTFGSATGDDYFDVDVADIPERRDKRRKEDDPEAHEIASALKMIADTDNHPTMNADQLRETTPTLYAIVFESGGEYIGFVRNTNPRRVIKPGMRYLQYGDTLKKIEPPDLAIDDNVDIVVASDRCAVMALNAFTTLFGDVGIAFQQVPKNVDAMSAAFKKTFPLTDASIKALKDRCGRRVIDAKRLHHVVTERRSALAGLSKTKLRALLQERGLDSSLNKSNQLILDAEAVSEFLDLVEGRLFNDDVTGQERRADTYSPRKH